MLGNMRICFLLKNKTNRVIPLSYLGPKYGARAMLEANQSSDTGGKSSPGSNYTQGH